MNINLPLHISCKTNIVVLLVETNLNCLCHADYITSLRHYDTKILTVKYFVWNAGSLE